MLCDFHASKYHVREEMSLHIDSPLSDLILTMSMKKYAFQTGIVYVFQLDATLAWSLGFLMSTLRKKKAIWSPDIAL